MARTIQTNRKRVVRFAKASRSTVTTTMTVVTRSSSRSTRILPAPPVILVQRNITK